MNPQPILVVLGFDVVILSCGWLATKSRRNTALADLLWSACISASALYYGLVAGGAMLPRLLVAMMGGIGGFRLFMHLLQRMLVEPGDSRDRAGSAQGSRASMLGFFLSKAASATLFSIPLYVAASNPRDVATIWTLLAAGVYIVGLSGEAYADIQLAQFRDQPRNRARTCRQGLWRYSRHPNYFFAFVHWCSYALLAVGLPWPLWSLTLLGPALTAAMAFHRISAVESRALGTRGEDYRAYQQSTSVLLPWPPKGDAAAWYTPPAASPSPPQSITRGTPLPGARITPSPSSRLRPSTNPPVTPQPERPLDSLRNRGETAVSRLAGDVDE
jgi:steroid 5-alpha reductase family enzyme